MTRQPNIIFILMDDMGWADLGCYGSTFHETPNLDHLATDGARFTSGYAAAPVCSPTRASLMSGKYPARVGVTQFINGHAVGKLLDVPYFHELPTSEFSIARALRAGGYQTWHVGKWHLGKRKTWPDQHGFDVNIGGCEWGQPKTYFSPYNCPTLPDGPDGEYLTDRLTDEAIALIDSADPDQPFFLNFNHYAVHIPIESPPELVAKYEQKARDLGLADADPFEPGDQLGHWHNRGARIRRRLFQSDPAYAAMIENLDTNIGRLLAALDRSGQADNTLVVFTSDNGGLATAESSPTCNAPLAEGKGWCQEGGVREPMIMRWPAVIAAGTVIDEPITSPDFYPTFLSVAGLPPRPEQHMDGVDVSPLLHGEEFRRGPIYWHYPHYSNQGGRPSAAIRDGDLKLIHHFEDGACELYDLAADLSETTNLVSQRPDDVTRLLSQLRTWMAEVSAVVPRPNPYPEPFADLASYYLHSELTDPDPRDRWVSPNESAASAVES